MAVESVAIFTFEYQKEKALCQCLSIRFYTLNCVFLTYEEKSKPTQICVWHCSLEIVLTEIKFYNFQHHIAYFELNLVLLFLQMCVCHIILQTSTDFQAFYMLQQLYMITLTKNMLDFFKSFEQWKSVT